MSLCMCICVFYMCVYGYMSLCLYVYVFMCACLYICMVCRYVCIFCCWCVLFNMYIKLNIYPYICMRSKWVHVSSDWYTYTLCVKLANSYTFFILQAWIILHSSSPFSWSLASPADWAPQYVLILRALVQLLSPLFQMKAIKSIGILLSPLVLSPPKVIRSHLLARVIFLKSSSKYPLSRKF